MNKDWKQTALEACEGLYMYSWLILPITFAAIYSMSFGIVLLMINTIGWYYNGKTQK